MEFRRLAALTGALLAIAAAPASAQLPVTGPTPGAYRQNDFGGFRNVLPPGENGFDNAIDLARFETTQARPPHSADQLPLYRDLLTGYRTLNDAGVDRFFKDASFGVQPQDVERTYSPRSDVTIVRDSYGVPHVYGTTRAGAEFGLGYATAEDRLFFLDVFRHVGRGELSSFAGGAAGNRAFGHLVWTVAPYTEADLQRQIDAPRPGFEKEGELLRGDL